VYKAIAANQRNTVLIMVIFLALIGGLGWVVSYMYGNPWIVVWTLVVAVFYAVLEYFISARMAMAINGGKEIAKQDAPELWRTVENLAIAEGLQMPRVFIIDDSAPNAFATGRNPKHAMVAATTGLLNIMDKRELTAVMAHEMGHVKNYDILVSMIVFGLVSVISLVCDIILRITLFSSSDNKNPVVMLVGLAALIIAPIVAILVQFAVSRQREYLADASSAMTTRDSEGMIMALTKLRDHAQPMRKQNTSTAHLYIANPLKKGFFSKIFSTHPPLDERIARLQANAEKF
jgi:heat shock protein HtpX